MFTTKTLARKQGKAELQTLLTDLSSQNRNLLDRESRLEGEIVRAIFKMRKMVKILDPRGELISMIFDIRDLGRIDLNEVVDNLNILVKALSHDNESFVREQWDSEKKKEELTEEIERLRGEIQ